MLLQSPVTSSKQLSLAEQSTAADLTLHAIKRMLCCCGFCCCAVFLQAVQTVPLYGVLSALKLFRPKVGSSSSGSSSTAMASTSAS
jgi:hypothetical protein